jgi:hypothetical protein
MWFETIKDDTPYIPFTGKGRIRSLSREFVNDFLISINVNSEFTLDDVEEFANTNRVSRLNLAQALGKNNNVERTQTNKYRQIKYKKIG